MNSYGPSISRNGLVLHLDVANQKGFFGEPTTNLNSDPFASTGNPGGVSWGGMEYTVTRTNVLPNSDMAKISEYWLKCELTAQSSARVAVLGVGGLTVGVDYTISSYVYSDDTNITEVKWVSHNGGISYEQTVNSFNSSDRYKIKRMYSVFRSVAGSQLEVLQTNNGIGSGVFYITGIQCEQKSYPTPVVNGTRGTTVATGGGLYDLSGNGKHGELVNGPIYNSNNGGSLLLDGSDDFVKSATFTPNVTNKSFIGWCKLTSTSQQAGGLIGLMGEGGEPFDTIVYNETGQGWGFGSTGFERTAWSGVLETSTSDWVCMAATYANNNYNLYRNGINILNTTSYAALNYNFASNVIMGKRHGAGVTGPLGAYISCGQFYSRTLSAQEVLNNFNATKGRFGL